MSLVFGSFAQVAPAATTLVNAYTVPAGKRATVTVIVCNRSHSTDIRISIAPNGAADAVQQYLMYDSPISANETISTLRFTVTAGDVIRVRSTSGNVNFNVNGIEELI